MSLEIGDAVSRGFGKLTSTAGLQLAIIYVVVSVVTTVGSSTLTAELLEQLDSVPSAGTPSPLALPIGVAGGAAILLVGLLLTLVLNVVILRTMAHDASALSSIPNDATDSLVRRAAYLFLAGIVVVVVVASVPVLVGVVLALVSPLLGALVAFLLALTYGLFVSISLLFTQVFVAVEDEGPIGSLRASWRLSSGNRLSIFLLMLVLIVLSVVLSFVGLVPSLVSPALGSLVNALLTGVLNIFFTAVVVDAYLQLTGRPGEGGDVTATATTP